MSSAALKQMEKTIGHLSHDEQLWLIEKLAHRLREVPPDNDAGVETDIEETDWLKAASSNPAFYFLRESGEDIYKADDGRPFRDDEG